MPPKPHSVWCLCLTKHGLSAASSESSFERLRGALDCSVWPLLAPRHALFIQQGRRTARAVRATSHSPLRGAAGLMLLLRLRIDEVQGEVGVANKHHPFCPPREFTLQPEKITYIHFCFQN